MAIESKMARGPIGSSSHTKQPATAWIWVGVLCILLISGGIFYATRSGSNDLTQSGSPSGSDYQAVFLDNGQVYFGKLDQTSKERYFLTDVFYLQAGSVGVDQSANLSLTKLGSEAHGPEDKMQINPDHVLFIETMKEDSKVVSAIHDYFTKQR